MSSMKVKFVAVLILIVGVLTACASQPTTEAPIAAQPTEVVVSATDTSAPAPATAEVAPATEPVASGSGVSFSNEILPILESRCLNCHGGDKLEEGLSVKSHADLMTGSENGAVIVAGDAVNSLLVELVSNQKMPKRGPKLTPPQVQLIVDWVNQGAQDN